MRDEKLIKHQDVRSIEQIYRGSGHAPMRIPNYQRAYAWTTDELNDYIGDLLNLKTSREQGEPRKHFMGGIVVYEEEKDDTFPRRLHYIVDGQQRLITFQITLAVIKEEYKILSKRFDQAKNTQFSHRTLNKINELERFFKFSFITSLGDEREVEILEASPMDHNVFQKVLNGEEKAEDLTSVSHRLIRSARNKIRKDIVRVLKPDPRNDEEYFKHLGTLLDSAKDDCKVIYIICPNLDDAYELFQVLNDRGKSLTDGDLLRAYTFQEANKYNAHVMYHKALLKHWDEILSSTEGQVKQFLEQYFRMTTDAKPQKKQLYRQLQEVVFVKDQNRVVSVEGQSAEEINQTRAKAIVDRMSDLRKHHRVFLKLIEGDWPYKILPQSPTENYDRYHLELLIRVLEPKNVSILLAAHEKLDQSEFSNLLSTLEKFFFRYRTICWGSADQVGNVFGRHAHRILNGDYDIGILKQDLQKLIDEDANDSTFMDQLRLNLAFKDNKTKQRIRYFLIFLEDNQAFLKDGIPKGDRKVDKSIIYPIERSNSVEHIYPQNPSPEFKNLDIERHESGRDLTNCLGNLTFLGRNDNSSLGNKPYLDKRLTFAKGVWLNRHLAEKYDTWGAESILEREKWLLEQATKVFRI